MTHRVRSFIWRLYKMVKVDEFNIALDTGKAEMSITHKIWVIVYDSKCTIEECLTSDLVCLLWVWYVWFALSKENLVTMRNHHLFEIINTNRKIKIFKNEKSYSTRHRAGPVPWTPRTNRPQLPVSTPRAVWTTDRPMFLALFWLPVEIREFELNFTEILIWIRSVMIFAPKKLTNA